MNADWPSLEADGVGPWAMVTILRSELPPDDGDILATARQFVSMMTADLVLRGAVLRRIRWECSPLYEVSLPDLKVSPEPAGWEIRASDLLPHDPARCPTCRVN